MKDGGRGCTEIVNHFYALTTKKSTRKIRSYPLVEVKIISRLNNCATTCFTTFQKLVN